MRTKLLLLFFTVAMPFLLAAEAQGCMCARLSDCELFAMADAVFVGTVLDVRQTEGDFKENIHKVQIDEVFWGEKDSGVVEVTSSAWACPYRMEKGESHLIFAGIDDSGDLYTSFCSGSRMVDSGGEVLKELREMKDSGVLGVADLRGMVLEAAKPPLPGQKPEAVSFVLIVPDKGGDPITAELDSEGAFFVDGIKPGRYLITPMLPPGYIYKDWTFQNISKEDNDDDRTIEVRDHGCTVAKFEVKLNGRISGRLVDSTGSPLAGIYGIDLMNLDPAEADEAVVTVETGQNGEFLFEGLGPGRYVLGVNLDDFITEDSHTFTLPKFFYPGSRTLSGASVIELGKSAEVRDIVVQALPKLRKRTVTGRIVGSDGKPVKGAKMRYHFRRGHRLIWGGLRGSSIEVSEQGYFSLEVYEDTEYILSAYVDVVKRERREVKMSSECSLVTFQAPEKPLTIKLERGPENCKPEERN
ncbi:MAG: hypothetical protein J5I65_00050 [Aridibacter famidurans]|nr:hypothetical protein [Aridibacter famidurans]